MRKLTLTDEELKEMLRDRLVIKIKEFRKSRGRFPDRFDLYSIRTDVSHDYVTKVGGSYADARRALEELMPEMLVRIYKAETRRAERKNSRTKSALEDAIDTINRAEAGLGLEFELDLEDGDIDVVFRPFRGLKIKF